MPEVALLNSPEPTIAEVCAKFDLWSRKYFGAGIRTRYKVYATAAKRLWDNQEYAGLKAKNFGPLKLIEIREELEASGKHLRTYINYTINCTRYIFRWAAGRQLIPMETYTALAAVAGLEQGHTTAREPAEIKCVRVAWVKATLPHLSANVQKMVRLQWLTGCRSGSLCMAKPEQFKQGKKYLNWRPRHKTEFRGKKVVLPLGPKARKLVERLLQECPPGEFLFSPRRLRNNRRYCERYKSTSYRRAIAKGIERANKDRPKNDQIPHWHPHQLRHTVGQRVRNRFGLEAAQATLAHESINATQIYARRRLRLARKVAAAIG